MSLFKQMKKKILQIQFIMTSVLATPPSKFVKKPEVPKISKYPRYHGDSLRNIIDDLKIENNLLRKKCETYETMYRKLEKEYNDYRMSLFAVREMDILGDDYNKNPNTELELETQTN